jgi:hypothetical protein
MSEWMGLHNPERHITTISGKRAMCNWEGQHNHDTWCDPTDPCYCCLAAEVEVLRAQVSVLEVCAESEATRGNEYEAQVKRVRKEVNGDQPIPRASDDLDNVAAYCAGYVDAFRRVRRALDGDSDE